MLFEEQREGYEGQFFGDYLAQHGYVVFSADAPMWGERGQKEGAKRDRYDMIAGNMMMDGIRHCLQFVVNFEDSVRRRYELSQRAARNDSAAKMLIRESEEIRKRLK